jgi:hypothetical protein
LESGWKKIEGAGCRGDEKLLENREKTETRRVLVGQIKRTKGYKDESKSIGKEKDT